MAEGKRLELNHIDIDYNGGNDEAAMNGITGYTSSLDSSQLVPVGIARGGPYTADGEEYRNLHALVDAFAFCLLDLHFPTFDKNIGGFGRITISPATGRVQIQKHIRYVATREEREDV